MASKTKATSSCSVTEQFRRTFNGLRIRYLIELVKNFTLRTMQRRSPIVAIKTLIAFSKRLSHTREAYLKS
ncbi:hypothetical protein KEJ18_04685 [Candidatus Bathyarchaeota archaeon]|nr:hypothetical protein [Candidatus Bathyarchaeota archaeon]